MCVCRKGVRVLGCEGDGNAGVGDEGVVVAGCMGGTHG